MRYFNGLALTACCATPLSMQHTMHAMCTALLALNSTGFQSMQHFGTSYAESNGLATTLSVTGIINLKSSMPDHRLQYKALLQEG